MRSLLKFWLLAAALLAFYGCSGDTVSPTSVVTVTPTPAPVATGNILVKFDLQPRLVPSLVDYFRFTGFSAEGAVTYGPKTFPKASQILLEQVPTPTARLGIELMTGNIIFGLANVPVSLSEGETFTVENVDFSTLTPNAQLAIDPATAVMSLGDQRTFTVISQPNEPNPVDVTSQATLTSSNPAVLRVDGPGLVTAVSAGSAALTASFDGSSATSQVTVTNAVITSVQLQPTTSQVLGQFQFKLVGTFSDGRTTDLTALADWSSDAPNVLRIENSGGHKGLARTVSLGSAVVTANYNGLTATQPVTTVGGARLLSFNGANSGAGNNNSGTSQNVLGRTMSRDGRFVVFTSDATDLLPAGSPVVDGNGSTDVYVRDLQTGINMLVSVNTAGTAAANGFSGDPVISADGRFVFFNSNASDLTPVAPPFLSQIYRRDLLLGQTEIVSLNGDAVPIPSDGSVTAPTISGDGNVLLFLANATNFPTSGSTPEPRVIWRNLTTGEIRVANLDSAGNLLDTSTGLYSLNQDGRLVAFTAQETPPGNVGPTLSVYVRDTQAGTSTLASVDQQGARLDFAEAPLLDGSGTRVLVFALDSSLSQAGTYSKNLATGELTFLHPILGTGISDDFRYLVGFSGNLLFTGIGQPTLVDLQTGGEMRLDVATNGVTIPSHSFLFGSGAIPDISGDGTTAIFSTPEPLDPIVTGAFEQVYRVLNPFLP